MASSEGIYISVIIPCYNQGQYLPEALGSVLQQTYVNWECIIVNDGSEDNTEQVALKYQEKDSRFKYLFQENKGLSGARNAGLRLAAGNFIQFLDADDYLGKNKFGVFVNRLSVNPELELLISNFVLFNQQANGTIEPYCNLNREFDASNIIKYWDIEFTIPIHCAIFNKKLLSKGFDINLKAKEDWVMWVDVFQQTPVYDFDNAPQAFYRIHQTNMTKDNLHMQAFTTDVFEVLYNRVQDMSLKHLVFNRLSQYNKQIIANKDMTIDFLRSSYTYKIGNVILFPLKKIKGYTNRILQRVHPDHI